MAVPLPGPPLPPRALVVRGLAGGLATWACALLIMALVSALEGLGPEGPGRFDLLSPLAAMLRPASIGDGLRLAGSLVLGAVGGLLVAAVAAARSREVEHE